MLTLFNTLTGKPEEFRSIRPKQVRMYVCGVTVYDYCHIGHGVTVVWTISARHSENLVNSGAVLIEARGLYRASGGEREVRLSTLRANPSFAGNH